jgi:hypothetical protein
MKGEKPQRMTEEDDRLTEWARGIAASLPPMTRTEVHLVAQVLARIDARRSHEADPRHDVGPVSRVGGSYDELPPAQRTA